MKIESGCFSPANRPLRFSCTDHPPIKSETRQLENVLRTCPNQIVGILIAPLLMMTTAKDIHLTALGSPGLVSKVGNWEIQKNPLAVEVPGCLPSIHFSYSYPDLLHVGSDTAFQNFYWSRHRESRSRLRALGHHAAWSASSKSSQSRFTPQIRRRSTLAKSLPSSQNKCSHLIKLLRKTSYPIYKTDTESTVTAT